MDSYHDNTSMVFHAPVQRRNVSSRGGVGVASGVLTGASPLRGYQATPPERSFVPLPPLPALLGPRTHLRPHVPNPPSPYLESWSRPEERRPSLDFILSSVRRNSEETRRPTPPDEKVEHYDHNHDHDRRIARQTYEQTEPWRGRLHSESSTSNMSPMSYASSSSTPPPAHSTAPKPRARQPRAKEAAGEPSAASDKKKRKARICTTEGCTKYVVDHGLCIRHGGGKRCYIEGCDCRAQNRGLCWKHGGFTICKVDGCTKRAKSRGICWSHGGGTRCKRDECTKIAVSNGLCWAHGGGKRCVFANCRKPASERTNNFCNEHFAWDDAEALDGEY